jgi:prepilin-type N-terminal cleavage/methylation domain-containing protein
MTCLRLSRKGFSLLELLIALSMASMLMLALYTAMRVTLKARDAATAAVDPVRSATIAMDLIQQDFEAVPPPAPSDTSTNILFGPFYGEHQAGGRGDNDNVEFCSIGADPIDGDVTQDNGQSPVLVRRVTRNLLPASEAPYDEEVLCKDVRSFSLRYFDGTTWQEDWDSTLYDDSLPLSVAVTLELGEANSDKPGQRISRVIALPCAKNALINGAATPADSTGGTE